MLSPKSDVLVKFGKIVKVKEKTQIKEAKDTTVIGHMYNGTHSFLHCVYLEQFSPYTCHINTPGKWSIFTLLETWKFNLSSESNVVGNLHTLNEMSIL